MFGIDELERLIAERERLKVLHDAYKNYKNLMPLGSVAFTGLL